MDAQNPIPAGVGNLPAPKPSRVRPSRRVADRILIVGATAATALGIIVLGSILLMLIVEGVKGFSPALFVEPTPGPGSEGGGIANAILGLLSNGELRNAMGAAGRRRMEEAFGWPAKLAELDRLLAEVHPSAATSAATSGSWPVDASPAVRIG